MNRRTMLTTLGAIGATVLGGCLGENDDEIAPNHLVQILNQRETSHDVYVEVEKNGEQREYGPETIMPGGDWDVERIESTGTLTVQVYVDDELVWDDTHDVPTPGGGRNSRALVLLEPEGEVDAFVEVEV